MWKCGRAQALTVVVDSTRIRVAVQLALYRFEHRRVRKMHWRTVEMGTVYALSWSIIPANVFGTLKETLLFQSNYAGDFDDYIAVFVTLHGSGLFAHFKAVPGFGKVVKAGLGERFIQEHDYEPLHYYSAYPEASPRDLDQFRFDPSAAPDPRWITMVLPLDSQHATKAIAAADDRLQSGLPFALSGVHFGRIVAVPRPTGSFLIVSMVVDDEPRRSNQRIIEELVAHRPSFWMTIAGALDPASDNPEAALLSRIVPDRNCLSFFCAPGGTKEAIRTRIDAGELRVRT